MHPNKIIFVLTIVTFVINLKIFKSIKKNFVIDIFLNKCLILIKTKN